MDPVLVLDGVEKAFGGLRVTLDVSFSVPPGSISAIIGPNGAGKTTLFNEITGYLAPDKGRILFQGEDITGLPVREIVAERKPSPDKRSPGLPDSAFPDGLGHQPLTDSDQSKKYIGEAFLRPPSPGIQNLPSASGP